MTDYSELLTMLRKVEGTKPDSIGIHTQWHRNPDGPEAARAIETLTRELGEARANRDDLRQAYRDLSADSQADNDTLRAELTDTKARLAEAVGALQDVANPLGNLQREADAQGARLNRMAHSIANDLGFVQTIARRFLAKQEPKP